ncbi:hypothetical protein HNY73_011704, partial [Argiope bruennichi]
GSCGGGFGGAQCGGSGGIWRSCGLAGGPGGFGGRCAAGSSWRWGLEELLRKESSGGGGFGRSCCGGSSWRLGGKFGGAAGAPGAAGGGGVGRSRCGREQLAVEDWEKPLLLQLLFGSGGGAGIFRT